MRLAPTLHMVLADGGCSGKPSLQKRHGPTRDRCSRGILGGRLWNASGLGVLGSEPCLSCYGSNTIFFCARKLPACMR